jgi:hypothetical protein
VLVVEEDRETFLVAPTLWEELASEIRPTTLFTAANRQNVLFLWPIRLPGPDGRANPWHESALQAAELAMSSWVRLQANPGLGAYEIFQASAVVPEPVWPTDVDFAQVVKLAFRDRYIASFDHPVLRRLRGEI